MTLSLGLILLILFAHFWSDFVEQTDWMAQNKSKSNYALWCHVGTYILYLNMFIVIFAWFNPDTVNRKFVLEYVIVNGLLHFIVDYCTSRITSALWKMERRHEFFVMIGFDQLIHYHCLFLTAFILQL